MTTAATTTHDSRPVLVIGARGKIGRRVARRLVEAGAPVRLSYRAASPRFDWDDDSTWAPALAGAGAAYVAFHPDLAVPGAADRVGALARLARAADVDRLVLLSGRGEPEAQRAEAAARAGFAGVTVVRSAWFAQNFSESFLLDGVLAGEVALPVGAVREPFVDAEDVAAVAVAALTAGGHRGRTYEVTGPRAITFDEAVDAIAAATGRPVRFRSVGLEEFAAGLAAAHLPPEVVALLAELFTVTLDGRNAAIASGVTEALGRPPRDFAEFAAAAAAAGAWPADASGAA